MLSNLLKTTELVEVEREFEPRFISSRTCVLFPFSASHLCCPLLRDRPQSLGVKSNLYWLPEKKQSNLIATMLLEWQRSLQLSTVENNITPVINWANIALPFALKKACSGSSQGQAGWEPHWPALATPCDLGQKYAGHVNKRSGKWLMASFSLCSSLEILFVAAWAFSKENSNLVLLTRHWLKYHYAQCCEYKEELGRHSI